jgi:hypothetical protein
VLKKSLLEEEREEHASMPALQMLMLGRKMLASEAIYTSMHKSCSNGILFHMWTGKFFAQESARGKAVVEDLFIYSGMAPRLTSIGNIYNIVSGPQWKPIHSHPSIRLRRTTIEVFG